MMTNEKISQKANEYGSHEYEQDAFYAGAKWMQEQSMRWVSVNKTTPATNTLILVCDKYSITVGKLVMYEFEEYPCWEDESGRALDFNPTHWCELPSPPTTE